MNKVNKITQYLLAVFIFSAFIAAALFFTVDTPRYDLVLADRKILLLALFNTLYISLITLLFSMILGFILFFMMRSKIPFVKAIAVIFKEIMMGTPLLIMVFLGVYVIGDLIDVTNKEILGILALTLYMSPYLANAYESAITVIDEEQYIVMSIYNFNVFQKYYYIILPQMVKPLIPSFINNLSSIIKGSALLKIVSVSEISYVITVISSKNWAAIEGYYIMWLSYLIITIPLSIIAQYIGKGVSKR